MKYKNLFLSASAAIFVVFAFKTPISKLLPSSDNERKKKIEVYYSNGQEFIKAIKFEKNELIQYFIYWNYVSPNYIDPKDGRSLLIWAVSKKNYVLIEFLINSGASVNYIDPNLGQSPLWIATLNNDLRSIELLITNNADINQKDKIEKLSPLEIAKKYKFIDAENLLLKKNS